MRYCLCLWIGIGLAMSSGVAHTASPASDYHVIKRIPVAGDGGWDYMNFDSASQRLYISRSTRVLVVDVEKGSLVGEIANTPGVHGIALAPKLHRGFTSNGGNNTVTVFDTRTLKEVTSIPVGVHPDCIIFDPATHRVFTFNGGGANSTAIDAASMKVVGTIPLGGRPEYAVADEKGEVFVNIEDKSEIVALDSRALTVKNRWTIAPGEEPSGLSMDSEHRRLFSVCRNGKMIVMDADTGHVLATPAIGRGPDASAFDPKAGLAFSSNGDGTLTVVREKDPGSFEVIANVPTESGARTMALDTKRHTIYLCTAKTAPSSEGSEGRRRRNYLSGSFVVLVVGK